MNAAFAEIRLEIGEDRYTIDSEARLSKVLSELYQTYKSSETTSKTAMIRLGQALNQIRDRYPTGTWEAMLKRLDIHAHTARRAMAEASGMPHKRAKPNEIETQAHTLVRSLPDVVRESERVPELIEYAGQCVGCGCEISEGVACEECQETLGDEIETDIETGEVADADDLYFGPARVVDAAGGETQAVASRAGDELHEPEQYIEAGRAVIASGLERARAVVNHAAVDGSKAGAGAQARPSQMTFDSIWIDIENRMRSTMERASEERRVYLEEVRLRAIETYKNTLAEAIAHSEGM